MRTLAVQHEFWGTPSGESLVDADSGMVWVMSDRRMKAFDFAAAAEQAGPFCAGHAHG